MFVTLAVIGHLIVVVLVVCTVLMPAEEEGLFQDAKEVCTPRIGGNRYVCLVGMNKK